MDLEVVIADTLGETKHEQSFPVIIRSRKNAEYINDLDSLGSQPGISAVKDLINKHAPFYSELPFSLPGCNFEVKLEI